MRLCGVVGRCVQTYELWDGETKAKCRVPWTQGTQWGGPDLEACQWPSAQGARQPSSEQTGNTLKGGMEFYLKAKARI